MENSHEKALNIKIGDHYNSRTLSRVHAPTSKERQTLEKSMKRNIAKKTKGNSPEAKNMRGKINYMSHLTARARNRGEDD